MGRSDGKSGAGREESMHLYMCEGSNCQQMERPGCCFYLPSACNSV